MIIAVFSQESRGYAKNYDLSGGDSFRKLTLYMQDKKV
jgi:hypothetical protein